MLPCHIRWLMERTAGLLGHDGHGHGNGMRGHARVRCRRLVAKSPVEKMLAGLRRHVGVQNKLTRVHAELLAWEPTAGHSRYPEESRPQ